MKEGMWSPCYPHLKAVIRLAAPAISKHLHLVSFATFQVAIHTHQHEAESRRKRGLEGNDNTYHIKLTSVTKVLEICQPEAGV
jgi:hypothetical protein